jgi:multidrug efflux system membrane fusion protein
MHRFLCVMAAASCAAVLAGCGRSGPPVTPPETPVVPVSRPIQRPVTDFVDYTGRTNAKDAVAIQPRVTGYLTAIHFKEGAFVKKDDLLMEIDPRPYQEQYAAVKAQVALNEASLKYAEATNKRFNELFKVNPGAVSARELDQYQALEEQAIANLNLSKANLNAAKLNLDWTKVTAPISGQVSRYFLTEGNLVNQDVTQLTTVVSMDPMYVYFDMDEPTLLRIKRAVNEGKITTRNDGATVRLEMGMAGEEGYPHEGNINFVDNQVNPSTGSISVRGVFSNHKPRRGGTYLLVPGMFVRVRLPIGTEQPQLLVIDRAVTSDQGLKYLYVIDADNKVEARRVTLGPLQQDGLRVVLDGLKKDDWVAIGNLQQIRPKMQVQPDQVTMPTSTAPAGGVGAPTDLPKSKGKGKK